jgi:hypothetical protein
LLDAYQTEVVTLSELHLRRQKLTTELHQLDRELQQLTHTQQQTLHWQAVIDHVEHFRHLLGENLDRLSFADRQTVAQCLIKKVVVTGEQVDISYILPFDHAPQVYNSRNQPPEGTLGHFYRLRLADLNDPTRRILQGTGIRLGETLHRGITEQDPFERLTGRSRLLFPHPYHRARNRRQFTDASAGSLRGPQSDRACTDG